MQGAIVENVSADKVEALFSRNLLHQTSLSRPLESINMKINNL